MIEIKRLSENNIAPDMLQNFNHYQLIEDKYVHINNQWEVTPTHELREWDREKRMWIPTYLLQQMKRGGSAIAAFDTDILVGFACVDGYLYGSTAKYANLTMLFVDDKMKRKGIGKSLFREICKYAKQTGAEKLFISAIPSTQTIAFYFNMGCVDAKEIIREYIDTGNDRYLEFTL